MLTSHLILPSTRIFQTEEAEQKSSVWLWTLILCLTSKNHWPTAGGQHGDNLSAKIGWDTFWP